MTRQIELMEDQIPAAFRAAIKTFANKSIPLESLESSRRAIAGVYIGYNQDAIYDKDVEIFTRGNSKYVLEAMLLGVQHLAKKSAEPTDVYDEAIEMLELFKAEILKDDED